MRRCVEILVVGASLAVVVTLAPRVEAKTPPTQQSKETERRRKLLEELGLDQRGSGPPAAPASAVPATDDGGKVAPVPPAEPAAPSDGKSGRTGGGTGEKLPRSATPSFRRAVHPLLLSACNACHRPGGPAATSRLLLSGNAEVDHAVVARFVSIRDPAASVLLTKVSGGPHGGGAPWPAGSASHALVLAWISKGARLDGGPDGAVPVASPPDGAAPVVVVPPPRKSGALPGAAVAAPLAATPAIPAAEPSVPAMAPPVPAAAPAGNDFASRVHPILMATCATCHRPGASAAMTRLSLSGVASADEAVARGLLDSAAPASSLLLTKASGRLHGGGVILPVGDPRFDLLLAWATGPASVPAPAAVPATPMVAAPSSLGPPPVSVAPGAAPAARDPRGSAELPFGFLLNGRFDIDYERRQFSGNPFGAQAVDALRSYHHFLFLSHENAADRCGLSVELLTLQFFDLHCRLTDRSRSVQVLLSGGKLIVPFGADPLYHQSYGGLAGFDQRILPVIWSQEGVAAHLTYQLDDLVLTDDLFVVRGYVIGRADAVLNLQNGFSPVDDARIGWGNRAGAAWRGISAWYSAYFNPLGFGRHLFMQAFDVTVWRQRHLPVVGHFSLGAGAMRADVAGGDGAVGGAGRDYYHFGSYFQLRYHPTDWLFAQYRQGLRTFDNRRGVILDNSRLTGADGSTHSFGVVARHGGVTGGVFYFVNLEKADEIPDDLLRVSVTYDF